MQRLLHWMKTEPMLLAAGAAAAFSCLFVPPSADYLGYLDWRVLALLFSLMVTVAGLRQAGLFGRLARGLCTRVKTSRGLCFVLVMLCFFSSMLVTNDVALLTFVPFSVLVLVLTGHKQLLVWVVVLQTVAANLGSMLTPLGNPQNLYLYTFYNMTAPEFLSVTAPAALVCLAVTAGLCLLTPARPAAVELDGEADPLNHRLLWLCLSMFAVCLLCVLRLIDWPLMLVLVVVITLAARPTLLRQADYALLLTFVFFFIFVGNLGRIPAAAAWLQGLVQGRELVCGALASQVISNVPAAVLLSGFTDKAAPLLLGVNLGGLGTPVASLASLISLKIYARTPGESTGRFLKVFLPVNFGLLAVLLAGAILVM